MIFNLLLQIVNEPLSQNAKDELKNSCQWVSDRLPREIYEVLNSTGVDVQVIVTTGPTIGAVTHSGESRGGMAPTITVYLNNSQTITDVHRLRAVLAHECWHCFTMHPKSDKSIIEMIEQYAHDMYSSRFSEEELNKMLELLVTRHGVADIKKLIEESGADSLAQLVFNSNKEDFIIGTFGSYAQNWFDAIIYDKLGMKKEAKGNFTVIPQFPGLLLSNEVLLTERANKYIEEIYDRVPIYIYEVINKKPLSIFVDASIFATSYDGGQGKAVYNTGKTVNMIIITITGAEYMSGKLDENSFKLTFAHELWHYFDNAFNTAIEKEIKLVALNQLKAHYSAEELRRLKGIAEERHGVLSELKLRDEMLADSFANLVTGKNTNMLAEIKSYAQQWASGLIYDKAGKIAEVLNDLNPTGGIFVDYTPESRANARLGDNITTLDVTSGGNPNDLIMVYRGAPSNQIEIVPGDFITTNYQLAKDYAGDGNVLKKVVRLGDVLDVIDESLSEEYIYRPGADNIIKNKAGMFDPWWT